MSSQRVVLLLTKDLFFVPTVQAAATKFDCRTVVALSPAADKVTQLSDDEVAACLIDLSIAAADLLPTFLAELRSRFPSASLVAYGPHVQIARLQVAEQSGCDRVLTRGQLSSQLDGLMAQWL